MGVIWNIPARKHDVVRRAVAALSTGDPDLLPPCSRVTGALRMIHVTLSGNCDHGRPSDGRHRLACQLGGRNVVLQYNAPCVGLTREKGDAVYTDSQEDL